MFTVIIIYQRQYNIPIFVRIDCILLVVGIPWVTRSKNTKFVSGQLNPPNIIFCCVLYNLSTQYTHCWCSRLMLVPGIAMPSAHWCVGLASLKISGLWKIGHISFWVNFLLNRMNLENDHLNVFVCKLSKGKCVYCCWYVACMIIDHWKCELNCRYDPCISINVKYTYITWIWTSVATLS